jgi:hypothetical protein
MITRKRGAPVLQDPNEISLRDMTFNPILRQVSQTEARENRAHYQSAIVENELPFNPHLHLAAVLLKVPRKDISVTRQMLVVRRVAVAMFVLSAAAAKTRLISVNFSYVGTSFMVGPGASGGGMITGGLTASSRARGLLNRGTPHDGRGPRCRGRRAEIGRPAGAGAAPAQPRNLRRKC